MMGRECAPNDLGVLGSGDCQDRASKSRSTDTAVPDKPTAK